MVQPCNWFKSEPRQFSLGQTAQSITGSLIEKPHTGLDDCLNILLSCFRASTSDSDIPLSSSGAIFERLSAAAAANPRIQIPSADDDDNDDVIIRQLVDRVTREPSFVRKGESTAKGNTGGSSKSKSELIGSLKLDNI